MSCSAPLYTIYNILVLLLLSNGRARERDGHHQAASNCERRIYIYIYIQQGEKKKEPNMNKQWTTLCCCCCIYSDLNWAAAHSAATTTTRFLWEMTTASAALRFISVISKEYILCIYTSLLRLMLLHGWMHGWMDG